MCSINIKPDAPGYITVGQVDLKGITVDRDEFLSHLQGQFFLAFCPQRCNIITQNYKS